jgi:hypothetical protein
MRLRIGVILSEDGMGTRFEKFRETIGSIKQIIRNFNDIEESIIYIFNKIPKESSLEISALIKESLKVDTNVGVGKILENILIGLEDPKSNHIHFVNLFDKENRNILIKKILSLEHVKKPKETFKRFLNRRSVDGIFSQLEMSRKHIVGSLKRGEWSLVRLVLKELFLLRDFVQNHSLLEPKIEQCYL